MKKKKKKRDVKAIPSYGKQPLNHPEDFLDAPDLLC